MPSFGNCSNSLGPAACVAESALDTANHLSDCFRFQTPIGYELSRFNFTIEHDVYTSRDSDLCRSDLVLLWRITRPFLEARSGLRRLLKRFRNLQHGVYLLSTPIPVGSAGGTISGWAGKDSPKFGTSSIEETESHTNRVSDSRLHPDGRGIQT
jgi:hypothetical protein